MRIRNVNEEYEVTLKLTGTAPPELVSAHGKGEWKVYDDGSRQCKVSVTHLDLSDGTTLQLTINGRLIGDMLLQQGVARFRRESEKGEFVPTVGRDERLQVILDGKIILEGSFYME